MEKIRVQTHVRSVTSSDQPLSKPAGGKTPYWQPGYLRRFPFLGFSSLLLVVLCTAAAVAVLSLSDQKSSTQWTVAPNVILSALNAVSNLVIVIAMTRGASIAWWRQAMHGATISELHGSWSQSSSFYEILRRLFRLDRIGVAAIAAKLAVVDGILFQRATTQYVWQDPARNISMLAVATTEFPQTGYVVSSGFGAQANCDCYMIGDEYTPVVNTWETSNGFFAGYNKFFQACDGTCFTSIEAIGFEIDCTKVQNKTNIATSAIAAYTAAGGRATNNSAWSNLPIFNTSFGVTMANQARNYSTIDFSLLYFQSDDPYNPSSASCPGTVYTVQCTMRPALVTYPITITNYTNEHITNGVSLGVFSDDATRDVDDVINGDGDLPLYSFKSKQAEGFTVGSYLYPLESQVLNSTTHIGGMANALSQYLSSSAAITYAGTDMWALKQQGTLAQTMMYGPPNMGSCDCSFQASALDRIVNAVNQLSFITATGLIDSSTWGFPKAAKTSVFPSVRSTLQLEVNTSTPAIIHGIGQNLTTTFRTLIGTREIRDVVHYKTDFVYMGVGAGLTLLCVLLITPLYWKYGELGRDVTLGPIEIAGAFRAPILSNVEQPPLSPANTDGNLGPVPPTPTSPTVPSSPAAPAIAFSNVDELLEEVGHRKVTYGFINVDEPGNGTAVDSSLLSPRADARKRVSMLAFQDATDSNVRPAVGVELLTPQSPRV